MNAIRVAQFGAPEVMRLVDGAAREPSTGQVVVDVKAVGVNPVDTYIRSGHYPLKINLPFTPGMDGAGIVTAVGDGVLSCAVGERVFFSSSTLGAYAQQILCDAADVYSLPDPMSFTQGAGIGIPFLTAYRALFTKARALAKDHVLIHGASGGVGLAALQLAKQADLYISATAGSEKGCALVEDLGADAVFNHTHPDYVSQLRAASETRPFDIILEMLANINLQTDLDLLGLNGRIVVIGCRGEIQLHPRLIMAKEAQISGVFVPGVAIDEKHKAYAAIQQYFLAGTALPIIGKEFSLSEAAAAHHFIMEEKAAGKVVLLP